MQAPTKGSVGVAEKQGESTVGMGEIGDAKAKKNLFVIGRRHLLKGVCLNPLSLNPTKI